MVQQLQTLYLQEHQYFNPVHVNGMFTRLAHMYTHPGPVESESSLQHYSGQRQAPQQWQRVSMLGGSQQQRQQQQPQLAGQGHQQPPQLHSMAGPGHGPPPPPASSPHAERPPALPAEAVSLLEQLMGLVEAQLPEWRARQIANTVWSLGKLGFIPRPHQLRSMLAVATLQWPAFTPHQLSMMLYGLCQLRCAPPQTWLDAFMAACLASLPSFKPQELSMLLYSLALFSDRRVMRASWFTPLMAMTEERLPNFNAQELSNMMWSITELQLVPDDVWLARFLDVSLVCIRGGNSNPIAMGMLVYSLGRLGRPLPSEWTRDFFCLTGQEARMSQMGTLVGRGAGGGRGGDDLEPGGQGAQGVWGMLSNVVCLVGAGLVMGCRYNACMQKSVGLVATCQYVCLSKHPPCWPACLVLISRSPACVMHPLPVLLSHPPTYLYVLCCHAGPGQRPPGLFPPAAAA